MAIARTPLAVAAAAVVVAGLTGCGMMNGFVENEKERSFSTWERAAEDGDHDFAPPEFVPEDATDIRMRMVTGGDGGLLRYSSATGPTDDECVEGSLSGEPVIDSSWWPQTQPDEGVICGTWRVFEMDGATYAFTG